MNFFQQGIPLGRWFGITVVIHWLFVLYMGQELFTAGPNVEMVAIFEALLFLTVLIHEFGHALACKAVGGEAYHIVLWPLGGIAFVQPPMRPWPAFITTFCGPLVNAVFWPLFWWLATYVIPTISMQGYVSPNVMSYVELICLMMWQINKGLLLFNLIPAYPMDGGRLFQEILWFAFGYGASLQVAGMVGTVAGGALIVLGSAQTNVIIPIGDYQLGKDVDIQLMIIGGLCMMQSFAIYKQSQQIGSWRKN